MSSMPQRLCEETLAERPRVHPAGHRFDTVRIAPTQHAEPFGFVSDPLNEERSFPARVFVPPMRPRLPCAHGYPVPYALASAHSRAHPACVQRPASQLGLPADGCGC